MRSCRFRVGQQVRVVKIIDDLKCQHIGRTGVVESPGAASTRGEPMYAVRFAEQTGHRFFEAELEEVP